MSTDQTTPYVPPKPTSADAAENATILFVDLDGSLTPTDVFVECLIRVIVEFPLQLGRLLLAAVRGRAALKRFVAERVSPNLQTLPLRNEILEFIAERRATGWTVVLATASDHIWAKNITEHLFLFDDVIASDGIRNLKGQGKLDAIRRYCQQNGFDGFSYIGDSKSDFPIWKAAAEAIVVGDGDAKLLDRSHPNVRRFRSPAPQHNALWRTMRPWQWLKNTLIFAPLFLSHQFLDVALVAKAVVAFAAMSLCASGIYVLNDLIDLESDRRHPTKRLRPIAAGHLAPASAVKLFVLLMMSGLLLSLSTLPLACTATLIVYAITSTLYAVKLKREAMADIVVLACLYTLRMILGGFAVGVEVSDWLLTLSIFLFTSLAFAKRHAELTRLESEGRYRASGRGYVVSDLSLIRTLGPCSGYLAVLVFALYSQSEAIRTTYTNAAAMWFICVLAMFWISRLWLIAIRGQLHEDPVVFAMRDGVSRMICVLVGILLLVAAELL